MDTVDVLTMAVDIARMIRSTADPELLLMEACRFVGHSCDNTSEPFSIRVARLVENAGDRRGELTEFLRKRRGPLYLNRPFAEWEKPGEVETQVSDPEAISLQEFVESDDAEEGGIDLLGEHSCPYRIGSREIVRYIELENVEQGKVVRGLIDYPLNRPVLFEIDLKSEMWYLWDILTAFTNQYLAIYENAEEYGIWGHDLDDLEIEQLFYFPEKRLIYPWIGS